jgi:inosine/xanthosine triphosphate pyrophosphatase family protein
MIRIPLVLATRNEGKTEEIRALLAEFPVDIKNLTDFGPTPEVEEDGQTFEDNAVKKARFVAKILGFPALADDSGLATQEKKPRMRTIMPNCLRNLKELKIVLLPLLVL